MRLFLDTADADEIRQALKLGVISGVTTNPSLLSRAGWTDYKSAIMEICSLVKVLFLLRCLAKKHPP